MTGLSKLHRQRFPLRPVPCRSRAFRLRRNSVRRTIVVDIEVLDAFGRQPWLGDARGWLAFASDRVPVKRQGTEVFENLFVLHVGSFDADAGLD